MRDADTIVIAPTIQTASKAGWLGYTARHVITPETAVRLRGRTIRRVLVVGYYQDDPELGRVMDGIAHCTRMYDDPHVTYH